jgi:hypothetical protein
MGGRRYPPCIHRQGVAALQRPHPAISEHRDHAAFIGCGDTGPHAELAQAGEFGKKYDVQFKMVFDAIRKLKAPEKRRRIDFKSKNGRKN